MASSNNNTAITLQICFGVFSALGILVGLAGLHYRDSLCCVVFHRQRENPTSACMRYLSVTGTDARANEVV
jgi:hypothetical protein